MEIEFYLIAPLLATVYLIRPTWLRRGLLIVLILAFAGTTHAGTDCVGFYLPAQICFFLTGYLLADLRIHQRPNAMHGVWDVVSVLLWPALLLAIPDYRSMLVMNTALFLCFTASMLGPRTRRLVGNPWLAVLGGMCYSIYLTHMLLLSAVYPLMRQAEVFGSLFANYAVEIVLLLPVMGLGGALFFVLVERPCMDPAWPGKAFGWLSGRRPSVPLAKPVSPALR